MKKLKRNNSVGVDKIHTKLPQNSKNDKPKLKQKKPNNLPAHKQNANIDCVIDKEKFFKPSLKKKVLDKKLKERSKSMLQSKKTARKFDGSDQKQNETFYQFHRTNQIKEEVDTIDPIDSFRYDQSVSKDNKVPIRFRQHPELYKQRETSTQFKKAMHFDQEIQCSGFTLNKCHYQQKELNQSQKREYQQKNQVLEKQIQEVKLSAKQKLNKLQQSHQKESKLLKQQIQTLNKLNNQLSNQKYNLQITIDAQRAQIAAQNEIHQLLEKKLKSQAKIKHELMKKNQLSQQRINILESQLLTFEQNINDFQRMKKVYEQRLDTLEMDKQRIKGNALELLQILHKIKSNQQN